MKALLTRTRAGLSRWQRWLLGGIFVLTLVSAIRLITDTQQVTSSGTMGAALRLAMPIMLAGLGGLLSERSGVVNIGLEGMLILGTWFGAWGAVNFGPWYGVLFGVLGGALGGLIHAVATVTFNVDHIVSGVAINILALGGMRFLSVLVYANDPRGGAVQSPTVTGSIATTSLPFLTGGSLFGWQSPDFFGWVEKQGWFLISDFFGLLRGLFGNVSWLIVIALLMVPAIYLFLWKTPTGLRLRSCGEHPVAAESLGVNVYRMKYLGVTLSGALAGLGGSILVLEFARHYREGQTGGRGFIGLASMIVGNWRPGGTGLAAGLFGFADALRLRDAAAVHALLLAIAVALLLFAAWSTFRRRVTRAVATALLGAAVLVWFLLTDSVPSQFVAFTPHVITLLVMAFASQHLRMPAADGKRYRKGEELY
jgi:ABC-type uncharacterized transport system permease subunit